MYHIEFNVSKHNLRTYTFKMIPHTKLHVYSNTAYALRKIDIPIKCFDNLGVIGQSCFRMLPCIKWYKCVFENMDYTTRDTYIVTP